MQELTQDMKDQLEAVSGLTSDRSVQAEMPKYRSHKQVWALKLEGITLDPENGACQLAPANKAFAVITETAEWYGSRVKDGDDPGYYVVYADGYKSWSPTKAFEEGYWPVTDEAPADPAHPSEMLAVSIARYAHEINRAYCQAIGDDSQPTWEAAPDWQRASAIDGVKAHLEEPLTPEQSHDRWSEHKLADGWMYGPVKDPEKKTHPCLVGYPSLPPEQRAKDHLFAAVVRLLR